MGRVLPFPLPPEAPADPYPGGRPSGVQLTGGDGELVSWLRAGDPRGGDLLVVRYAGYVQRLLYRVLGRRDEIEDLSHEVFLAVLHGVHGLRDDGSFRAWLTRVVVFTARDHIRRRQRRWWMVLSAEPPEDVAIPVSDEVSEAARATYAVLARLDPDDRVPFTLRRIEGMELTEVAAACDVSLATIKRHLARAEARFLDLARREPALAAWVDVSEGGGDA